jgi:hypothetical protein
MPGGEGGRPLGIQVTQVPAQPVLDPGPLGDQVLAVADQQLELPGPPIQAGLGQLRFLRWRAQPIRHAGCMPWWRPQSGLPSRWWAAAPW